ncbi:hypothetical protein DKW60_11365 [Leucothrix pacifica]|uniref:Uncharacterized protein n=1 Tax=Leucothrix pacifica TaxID=1247513 RepID=A0A317CHX8_9GAMM|nr:hypothetical protein DKW60_11365 [Leucothrix pacifica]
MNKLSKAGVMPRDQFQKRILDIAAGRITLDKNDPKTWFSSEQSLRKSRRRGKNEFNFDK